MEKFKDFWKIYKYSKQLIGWLEDPYLLNKFNYWLLTQVNSKMVYHLWILLFTWTVSAEIFLNEFLDIVEQI